MMETWGWDEHKQRFLQLMQEADCIELLQWCRQELERRLAGACAEKARSLRDGDMVEVTEGPLTGICGKVVGHCYRAAGSVLVELHGLELGVPLPIPVTALRVLVASGAPA
jgi:hypothetical protein